MATHPIALPQDWDDRTKYFYRKYAGLRNQPLIDELRKCLDIHQQKRLPKAPYTISDVARIAKVIIHILEAERDLDLDLAEADYDWLEKEVDIIISRP